MGSRVKATTMENSIAVCGKLGTIRCHGYLQRHDITVTGTAEGVLMFTARSLAARRWLSGAPLNG